MSVVKEVNRDKVLLAEAIQLIKDVEWEGGLMYEYCPWCHGDMDWHKPDCARQAFLAKVEE